MRLTHLVIKNYRLFTELALDFHPKLTVIVAPNGCGKTTVLDAIRVAYSPYLFVFPTGRGCGIEPGDVHMIKTLEELGQMEPVTPVEILAEGTLGGQLPGAWKREKHSLKGRTTIKDARLPAEFGKMLQKEATNGEFSKWPLIAYYGTGRLWSQKKLTDKKSFAAGFHSRAAGYIDCMEPASSYKLFLDWFSYASRSDNQVKLRYIEKTPSASAKDIAAIAGPFTGLTQAVQRAVNTVLAPTGWGDIHFSETIGSPTVQHPKFGTLQVDQMSDGIRNTLALAADIAYRCVQLNAHLGENAITETEGIILVDEVDMHLHPEWQQLILGSLRDAFPALQFIVTTHSPQVLTTVPPECIRELNWLDETVQVDIPDFSLGAESPQILESIQGVNPRPQQLDIVKKLNRYLELVGKDEWDGPEAKALRVELDAWGAGHETALAKADIDIRMRSFRRGHA